MRIDVRFMEILRAGSWGKGETFLKMDDSDVCFLAFVIEFASYQITW